jgi:hypothetical protein
MDLVPEMRKSHRPHGIVMAVVIAVALVPVITVLGPAPSGALPSTRQELVTLPAPAAEDPVIPQSLGYLVFDWSGDGGVPGFGLLSDNSN